MNAEAMAIITLLEGSITHLPVTPEDIETILRRLGWKILRYDLSNPNDISKLEKLDLLKYTRKYKTFSYKFGEKKFVVSPTWLTATEKAHGLAHELGHIKYGHFSETGILGHHQDPAYDDFQEAEAEEFARAFLAPYCILRKMNSLSEENIAKYTSLNDQDSKTRASECRSIHRRLDTIENKLVNNFKNYIDLHSKTKNFVKIGISVFLCAVCMCVFTIIDKNWREDFQADTIKTSISLVQAQNTETITQTEIPVLTPAEEQQQESNTIIINGFEYNYNLIVYKTRTGKKFHKQHCRHIKNRTGVTSMSIEDAFGINLESCADCF